MARSYEIHDLITLPKLDASGADTLVTELLTCAKGKKLSAPIEKARKFLAESQKDLQAAKTLRLQAQLVEDTPRIRDADVVEDAAFSATYDWLTGLSRLPDSYEKATIARRLLAVLFADGLKFTQLPVKLEWAEADARLRAVAEDPTLEKAFSKLGGADFLTHLRAAHKEYGEALGVTTVKAPEAKGVPVREPLLAVRKALRTYALRVLAHDDENASDEDDTSFVDSLLGPLFAWESPGDPAATKVQPPGALETPKAPEATTSGS